MHIPQNCVGSYRTDGICKEGEQVENYSKYALKPQAQLEELLDRLDNIFVVACNKCFVPLSGEPNSDLAAFEALCEKLGKTVTGKASLDFVCNKIQTDRILSEILPEGTENIVVISCGLGVQTVASISEVAAYAAADSIPYPGHHGMALTKRTCEACAQCYLNITGGICPIVDCSKSLVNGQCGGAKNGKCEVDGDMECGWERIIKRLTQVGRLDALKCPVQVRNYATDDEVK